MDKKFQIPIRYDFIMMVIILLKIWQKVDLSWGTIILMIVVPMIVFRLLKILFKPYADKIKTLPPGKHKIGRLTVDIPEKRL